MNRLIDFEGNAIRLPFERARHIHRQHPEAFPLLWRIPETLADPDAVTRDAEKPEVYRYYRFYRNTVSGDKFLAVIAKVEDDGFILTAFLTGRIR